MGCTEIETTKDQNLFIQISIDFNSKIIELIIDFIWNLITRYLHHKIVIGTSQNT